MKALLLFFLSAPAFAADCGWNSDHSFWSCGGGFSESTVGVSGPMLGDSIEGNPAAIPSSPTPFGLEGIYSNRSFPKGKPKFSVSTIKGFDTIGFGIGSWSEGTFSAPDLPNHFLGSKNYAEYQQYERNPPSALGLRLGTSLVLPPRLMPKGIRVSFGGSAGLGRVKGDWSPQLGILIRILGVGFGYSQSFERISTTLPRIRVSTLAAGFPLGNIYLGYARIIMDSDANHTLADVFALRWASKNWTLYGNLKQQKDHRGQPDAWYRAGIQRRLGNRFGLGYDYGLYRYAHSALLQIYL